MKKLVYALIITNLIFPMNIFAQSTNEAATVNLVTGTQRYELISDAVVTLEDPNGVQALGEPADSLSIPMSAANDAHLAAGLSANESESSERSTELATRCSNEALEQLSQDSNLQLYSLSCRIYEYVNSITGYFAEADQLEKQLIENKTTMNQATAETQKRNAEIAKEKEKMNAANKEIKSAIAKIEANKKAVVAAQEAVKEAEKALAAANAKDCGEDEDGSCASAKAAEVKAATEALEKATKKLEAAKLKLDKSVAKLIDLLVNKLGLETSAVLAILSGTAVGDADGTSVNFQVNGSDYSLVDLDALLADGERRRKF
jgi:chromosome segregation ATPase